MSGSCIETAEAPAWLSKLESQREKLSKGKLGHDSGAGAACNACGSKCPGLDLHFWRKVCRACHCPKDLHDVQDDDLSGWAQFELLGTARPKKNNCIVMKIRGISDEPVKLEWVPPNTSPDMVSDYMSSLGDGLAPVAGSGGAARRREQLRRQIPLHDINSDLCCHKLTQQEQLDHQEYISRIKNQVVGMGNLVRIGTIQKGDVLSINNEASQPVAGTKSYSLPLRVSNLSKGIKFANVPKNTTDKHLVLDNMGNVITKSAHIADYKTSPIISRIVRDKLNYLHIESDRIKSAVEHGPVYDRLFKDLKQLNVPVENDVYLNPIKNFRAEYNVNPKFKDETTAFVEAQGAKVVTPCSLNNNENSLRSQMLPNNYSQNGTIFGPNGEIWSWATQTENPNDYSLTKSTNPNYLSNSDNVAIKTQHSNPLIPKGKSPKDNSLDESSDLPPPPPNYDTYPGELNHPVTKRPTIPANSANYNNLEDYDEELDTLSPLKSNSNAGAYPGNRNPSYPHLHGSEDSFIPEDMLERVGELMINPNDNNLEATNAMPCQRCNLPFKQGQVVVNAERAGEHASWHPQCFTCHKCNQLLADMVYFYYQGEVYCARDFAEAMEIPRCAACDELIFSRSYTAAEDRFFHVNHFCCYHCDIPLGGKKYIPDNKSGQPMCLDCDFKFHAVKCNTCKVIIGPEEQGVSWTTFHWHKSCFNCSSKLCRKSLIGGRFVVRNDLPYCSAACVTVR